MYIHPSSPNSATSIQSEESAAIKIQAGFRGYRVRKQLLHQQRPTINGYHQHRSSSHRRRHQRQQQQRQQNMENTNAQTLSVTSQLRDDNSSEREGSSVEDRCATKIQAGVRGYLVRKKQKIATDAATKIQAGFRGFKARKETQKMKQK